MYTYMYKEAAGNDLGVILYNGKIYNVQQC